VLATLGKRGPLGLDEDRRRLRAVVARLNEAAAAEADPLPVAFGRASGRASGPLLSNRAQIASLIEKFSLFIRSIALDLVLSRGF
jgi:hypothetical protein